MTRLVLAGYALILVYASLFHITGWTSPDVSPWRQLLDPGRVSRTDLLANVLVYVPLGSLLARSFPGRARAVFLATIAGSALSLSIELLQAFLPGRVSSIYDFVANSAGTLAGAGLHRQLESLGPFLRASSERLLEKGPLAKLGAVVFGVWAAGQLFPYVPSPDIGNVRAGLRPVWHVLRGSEAFSPGQTLGYALTILALSIILAGVLAPRYRRSAVIFLLFGGVLFSKVPIVRQQLSIEALVGAACAFLAFSLLRRPEAATGVAVAALAGAVLVDELRPGGLSATAPINWMPFRLHLANDLIGIEDILDSAWPFLGFSFLAIRWRPERSVAVLGALAAFSGMLALEWAQQFVPGRSPDMTDAVVAAAAWILPWVHVTAE